MPAPAWQDPAWQHPAAPPAAGAPPAGTPGAPPVSTQPQSTLGGGFIGDNTMNDPTRMGGWTNWMTSGGVNPGGWQNTGGTDPNSWAQLGGANAPNNSFLSQFNGYLSGGANPTQVDPTSAANIFQSAQPYADQAYQQATRELDPQTAQQTAEFNQQMVGQGIPVGSAAYNQAKQSMDMQQNDAYNQARAQAQTTGLQAQGQGFGQGLSQSQLANTMAGQLLGSNTSMYNQQLGGNASVMNQMLGGNSSLMNQLLGGNSGIAQQIIGGQFGLQGANAAAGASRANGLSNYNLGMSQLAQNGQQSDWNNLMQMMGMGSGATTYNNGLLNQNQTNAQGFFGYMPQGGSGSIDAQSPYNNYYNGQQNQWNYNNNQANSENQAGMSLAMMALLCDREAKDTITTFDINCEEVLRTLPVDEWTYKGQDRKHIGTYAQDFNAALGLGEAKLIQLVDMIGFLLKAAKEQTARLDRIERKLEAA